MSQIDETINRATEPAECELEAIAALLVSAVAHTADWRERAQWLYDRGVRIQEVGPALPAPPDAFAWLIEDAVMKLGYYGGVAWTHEHLKAVRYSRREDAERAIMGLPNGWHLIGKAVEHGWSALPAPEPPPEPTVVNPASGVEIPMRDGWVWACARVKLLESALRGSAVALEVWRAEEKSRGAALPAPEPPQQKGKHMKEIVKPWYCVGCWSVYHDHDGSLLAALKAGKPATCDLSRAPANSPSQSGRCGGEIQPLAWP